MATMKKIILFSFILLISQVFSQDLSSPIVNVEQGQVQGSIKSTPEGRQFYAYQGIPFAKPPTGPLRFKAPEFPDPWTGVLQVTSDPPDCMQSTFSVLNPTTGSEDCLQLNVFTPLLPNNTTNPSLPVHVYIHGGAFFAGAINYDDVNPERYMNKDMVVVALKYRLGPLGFLATDDEAASGNWGLLDQNLGLQWVQRNIAAFGGNPNDVTLSGQSAGSASVLCHYQSPMSEGLFHRAIAESGSSIHFWAVQEDPRYYAFKMGERLNCTTDDDSTELIQCLRDARAEDIVASNVDIMLQNLTLVFTPSVETSPSGKFLTENPVTALQNGHFNKVPLQLGFNRDEGIFIFEYCFFLFVNISDYTFDAVVPIVLHMFTDYRQNLINVSYAIRDEYYTGVDMTNQTAKNIATIAWMSDIFMKSGVAETASLVSTHNIPVYLYAFNYVSDHGSYTEFTGEPDIHHGDELQYLWYRLINDNMDNEFDSRFFPLWANFILQGNHGSPSSSDDIWLATPAGSYNYYDIKDTFTMEGNYDPEKMAFWWYTVPAIVYGS